MDCFPACHDFGWCDYGVRPGHAAAFSIDWRFLCPFVRCFDRLGASIGCPLLAVVQGEVILHGLRRYELDARFQHIPINRNCWTARSRSYARRCLLARRVRGPPFAQDCERRCLANGGYHHCSYLGFQLSRCRGHGCHRVYPSRHPARYGRCRGYRYRCRHL